MTEQSSSSSSGNSNRVPAGEQPSAAVLAAAAESGLSLEDLRAAEQKWIARRGVTDIRWLHGDATDPDAPDNEPLAIAHSCNDRGAWGAGFVLAVSRRWPEPEAAYRSRRGQLVLGEVQMVQVQAARWRPSRTAVSCVANMVAQDGFPEPGKPDAVDYSAMQRALWRVGNWALIVGASVHMPRIGAGLGGGDWSRVEQLVRTELCERGVPVTVYDWPDPVAGTAYSARGAQ